MKKGWEHYAHTADMGIRGFGSTAEEAFASAALAMVAVSVEPEKIEQKQKVDVTCHENDIELLFIEWLNSILYEMATRKMLFSRFEVAIEAGHLTARMWGEKIDLKRHQPSVEIKATTYSDLKVEERNGIWMAQCIIDI